jgi:hypothetical protein
VADPISVVYRTLQAITLLGGLISEVAQYIGGGKKTAAIKRLPKELQSEIELKRLENRA